MYFARLRRRRGDAGPRRALDEEHVAVPDRPDRADAEHRGPHPHPTWSEADGDEPPGVDDAPGRLGRARRQNVPARSLFIFIGAAPRTDWLAGVVERDEHGFVLAGRDLTRGRGAPEGLDARPRPLPAGDQRPGHLRRRRRPPRLRQARRLRRRRRRDRGTVHPSVSGECVRRAVGVRAALVILIVILIVIVVVPLIGRGRGSFD